MTSSTAFWMVFVGLVLLHFFLQVGFAAGSVAPDLLTVALLLGARESNLAAGAGMGFLFGIMEDAFSALAFGANALAMSIVGLIAARTRDLFVGDSLLFMITYLVAGKWLRDLIHWVAAGEGIRGPFVETMLVRAPLAALYAAAVGIVVMLATGAWRESR